MKRILLLLTATILATTLYAQENTTPEQESVIYLDSSKENSISSSNGRLSLMLNGTRLEIGNKRNEALVTMLRMPTALWRCSHARILRWRHTTPT